MQVAFYRGRKAENPKARLFDWLICWKTKGPFSHAELVTNMTDGGVGVCSSSSIRDGGVRTKIIALDNSRWLVLPVVGIGSEDRELLRFMGRTSGAKYDFLGILGFLLPRRVQDGARWYCSEWVARAIGQPNSNLSPTELALQLGWRGEA